MAGLHAWVLIMMTLVLLLYFTNTHIIDQNKFQTEIGWID